MKKFLSKVLIVFVATAAIFWACAEIADIDPVTAQEKSGTSSVYIQASNPANQVIPVGAPVKVNIGTNDGSNDIMLSGNEITVEKAGEYLCIVAPQVGFFGKTAQFTCFLKVNGMNVPNSNVLLQGRAGTKDVIVSNSIVELEKGDKISVWGWASNTGVKLEAIAIPGQPLVPSIIVSVAKI